MLLPAALPPLPDTHHRGARIAPAAADDAAALAYPAAAEGDATPHVPATAPATVTPDAGDAAAAAATATEHIVVAEHVVEIASAIVVDDESTLRRLAHRMLSTIGLACVTLEDGSALAAAIMPDTGIVLLDIVMKRSDGVQVGGGGGGGRPFSV